MNAAARARLCAVLLPIALVSCLWGKRISDIDAPDGRTSPAHGPLWSVPPGVVVTPSKRGERNVDGLYPATAAGERCCWIAPDATIRLQAPVRPAQLQLDVLVPAYPFFERQPQTLTVSLATTTQRFSDLGPGVHRLRIEIAQGRGGRHSGIVTIALHTERSFVPQREGFNADTRPLGLILLDVSLRPANVSD